MWTLFTGLVCGGAGFVVGRILTTAFKLPYPVPPDNVAEVERILHSLREDEYIESVNMESWVAGSVTVSAPGKNFVVSTYGTADAQHRVDEARVTDWYPK